MTIKLKKCYFISETIDYLDHIIEPAAFYVTTKSTKAINALQYPTVFSELVPFLKLRNHSRPFVLNFAKLALPLNERLKKGEPLPFNLDKREMNVVSVIKEMLITQQISALSRSNEQFAIDTDACVTQMKCVLLQ